jgi:hypothetical protein
MSLAKKQFSAQFQSVSLDVPPALDQIAPESLAGALGSAVVVDVRQPEEYARGHIAGSRNVPFDEESFDQQCKALCADIAASAGAGRKTTLVFVSFQSPDLDMNAALHFEALWADAAPRAEESSGSIAQTLLGGVCLWLQRYRTDATLTLGYDAAYWEETLAKMGSAESP